MAISSNINYDTITDTSVSMHGYYSSGGTQAVRAKFYDDNGNYFADDTTSGSTDWITGVVTKTGLSADTSYTFTVHFYDSNGASLTSSSMTVRTDPPPAPDPPSWSTAYATSPTEVYLDWSSVSGADKYEVQYRKDGVMQYKTVYSSSTYIGGLDPATSYTFYVLVYDGYNWSDQSSGRTVTTEDNPRPSYFYFSSSIYSGATFNISATDWNSLTQNINDVREWDSRSTESFTYVYSGDDVRASIFNQARDAISSMYPPTSPPSSKYSGDTIYASDFQKLEDSLNSK